MTIDKVIITGGANGIGKALVEKCLDDNMHVITCDIDKEGLENLKERHSGRKLEVHLCDVGSYDDVRAFFSRVVTSHPTVNGLVNNAGYYLGQPVFEYDNEAVDRVIDINVKGPLWLSRLFARHLLDREESGSIVNLSSVAGEVGSSDALYGTVKAGIIGLTKSNAMNFAPNIRVNVVSPGLVENTRITGRIPEYRYRAYKEQELLDTDIEPSDVANAIAFLLSDESRAITGSLIPVDNGCYPR